MTVDDLVARWGSQHKVAVALGCSQSAVAKWVQRNNGNVPWPYQCVAQVVTNGDMIAIPPPAVQHAPPAAGALRPSCE